MFTVTWLGILCFCLLPLAFGNLKLHYPEKPFSVKKLDSVPPGFENFILPKNCKPTQYELTFLPFSNKTFNGLAKVTMDIINPTDTIVIHSNPNFIQVGDYQISSPSQVLSVKQMSVNNTYETLTFKLNDTLSVQEGVNLTISYEGIFGNNMLGFYLSTYNTSTTSHTMGITQFESTNARRAFPCFDEPAYRANFSINIYRKPNETSMSNMPLQSFVNDSAMGLFLDTYETTPKMPTYLVAFGYSDLASISDNKTVRVFARPAAIQDGLYTLGVSQPILDNIGNFTGITYPLAKMDIVAVPDFDAGAMENWGLTTYREKYVLYNPLLNTLRDKFMVLSVVAHEFGHQWFGDLVTPEWWDYAWLNEAFATYFEYTIPNKVDPSLDLGSTMYVTAAVQYALSVDIGNPRPMTSPVYTPEQIENIFDYVIYEKGGSILRMTENFLTTPVWKAGLQQYLKSNSYGTGTPEKLFSALQDAANSIGLTTVNETLQGWTTQPGYPVVTVTHVVSLANTTNTTSTVYITQAPYAQDSNVSLSWNVPLTYTTQSHPVFDPSMAKSHWLLPGDNSTSQINVNESGWIIFNLDQVGFYRVNYDSNNWLKLKRQLHDNYTMIGYINRAQLIDDAFQLAKTGHLDIDVAFGLTDYLPGETAFAPWNAFFQNINSLTAQFSGTVTGEGLKQYAQHVVSSPFRKLAANLSQSVSTFSGSLIVQALGQFACDFELPECENMALFVFKEWKKDTSSYLIMPEVKQTVFCTGLRQLYISQEDFMDVFDYYLNSNNAAEKLSVLNAMGCLNNDKYILMLLDIVCDTNANHVRLQDRWIVIKALLSHQSGIRITLQYVADNYHKVSDALGPRISTIFSTLANNVIQEAHINQVRDIINNSTVDQGFRVTLNSTVLPAVTKRQDWLASKPGLGVKSWVYLYMRSSGVSATASVFVLLAVALLTLINLN